MCRVPAGFACRGHARGLLTRLSVPLAAAQSRVGRCLEEKWWSRAGAACFLEPGRMWGKHGWGCLSPLRKPCAWVRHHERTRMLVV